jgi:hypothetical protein
MKKIFGLIVLTFTVAAFFPPASAMAADGVCQCSASQTATTCTIGSDDICKNLAACQTTPGQADAGAKCVAATAGTGTPAPTPPSGSQPLTNPLSGVCKDAQGQQCIQLILGNIIKTALGVVGSIALLMAVYGGFLWLTSMGNESKVETGKKTLIWSVLGLALIFGAYAITTFIFQALAPVAAK